MSQPLDPTADFPDLAGQDELAAAISELTERLHRGDSVELADAIAYYPKLRDELKELWPMVMLTELAGSVAEPETTSQSSRQELSKQHLPMRFGDFQLSEEIGRGGMGVVYRAHQVSLGREVALKLILLDHLASETDRARFYAEARAAARLENPNIVPVYDLGQVEGRPYICMKLIEGTTLAAPVGRGADDRQRGGATVGPAESSRSIRTQPIGFASRYQALEYLDRRTRQGIPDRFWIGEGFARGSDA